VFGGGSSAALYDRPRGNANAALFAAGEENGVVACRGHNGELGAEADADVAAAAATAAADVDDNEDEEDDDDTEEEEEDMEEDNCAAAETAEAEDALGPNGGEFEAEERLSERNGVQMEESPTPSVCWPKREYTGDAETPSPSSSCKWPATATGAEGPEEEFEFGFVAYMFQIHSQYDTQMS
jgi:hypothetical protein